MSSATPTPATPRTPGTPTTSATSTSPATPTSVPGLEAEIAARRERLGHTIDELTHRVSPRTILQRQTEAAKARFADVAQTPEGDLRVERLAAFVAAVAVVAGLLLHRRLRRS